MRSSVFLLLFSLTFGCGDDSSTPGDAGGGDTGAVNNCPVTAPNREAMMPPCCFRRSNTDQLDAPELRLAALSLTAPSSLMIVNALLPAGFDDETLNWLVRGNVTGATAMITTGSGIRSAGDTFAFDTAMYPPVTLTGTVAGETLTMAPFGEVLTVPIRDGETGTLIVDLPLHNVALPGVTLSENRSCVGARPNPSRYDTTQGTLSAFVTVADGTGRAITYATLDTTLCMLLAAMAGPAFMGMDCDDVPRAMWMNKPDSICDGMTPETCMVGGCDPDTDCNAWQVIGGVAAQGVEITN